MATFPSNEALPDVRERCPNTGLICEARSSLIGAYTTHVSAQVCEGMKVDEYHPAFDQAKLDIRLREYDIRAKLADCADATTDQCPVRLSMNQSPVRRGLVKTVRSLLGRQLQTDLG